MPINPNWLSPYTAENTNNIPTNSYETLFVFFVFRFVLFLFVGVLATVFTHFLLLSIYKLLR